MLRVVFTYISSDLCVHPRKPDKIASSFGNESIRMHRFMQFCPITSCIGTLNSCTPPQGSADRHSKVTSLMSRNKRQKVATASLRTAIGRNRRGLISNMRLSDPNYLGCCMNGNHNVLRYRA